MRAILTYHSIDPSSSPISLDEGTFAAHVRWLVSSATPVVSLRTLLSLPPTADAVALTFDDGFENFATRAWPLLRDHGLPATLFVPTEHVGGTNAWDAGGAGSIPVLPLLGWDELGALHEQGVELGAHTRTHPDLRTMGDSEVADELQGAAARLSAATGSEPATFAYPYGALDARVVAAVRGVYSAACTTEYRVLGLREDPHLLPRLDAFYFRDVRQLHAWGSARFRQRVWLRARARGVRRALIQFGVL